MSRRDKRESRQRREQRRFTVIANARRASSHPSTARRSWPIVASYVPDPDVWRVSGCGSAAVFRQRPDGRIASAAFNIELMQGGITMMYGREDHADLEDALELIEVSEKNAPPMVPGDADLATRYVHGAYAFGLELGYDFPAEERRLSFGLLPVMSGTRNWWLQQFTSDDMTPPRLIEVVRQIDVPDDLPRGKEVVCFTTASFELLDPVHAFSELMQQAPELEHSGVDTEGRECFTWTREYPKRHWSPLASLGGRQIIGDVTLRGSELRASSKVMSMAGRLVTRLKQILGDSLRLRGGEWQSVAELLRERDGSA